MTLSADAFSHLRTITVKEAASLLGISPSWAQSKARRGDLPGVVVIQGRYRVSLSLLRAHLATQASDPPSRVEPTQQEIDAIPPGRRAKCAQGHWMTEANTYVVGPRRKCRTCNAQWTRQYHDRRKSDGSSGDVSLNVTHLHAVLPHDHPDSDGELADLRQLIAPVLPDAEHLPGLNQRDSA